MTVWSLSTFYNELDVLEIRLRTLDPLVDVHVLAEATVDQRGNPKPLFLGAALESERFAEWADRIRYVVVGDMPDRQEVDASTAAHWEREHWQRDALGRGLDGLRDDDLLLISDLDEVPYPDALEQGLYAPGLRFPMDMHVYRLSWRWPERPVTDGSTAVVRRGSDLDGIGVHDALLDVPARWREDAAGNRASSGWHLAYQADADGIRRKTQAIADDAWAQLVPDEKKGDPDWWPTPAGPSDALLERCLLAGADVFGRDHRQAEWVGLDQLPPCVEENVDAFAHMLAEHPLLACVERPGCGAIRHLSTCPAHEGRT